MIIQRIQTIYLLISVLCCVLLIHTPFALPNDLINFSTNMPIAIAAAVIGVLAFGAIFLFKKAKLQLSICKLLAFLFVGIIGVTAYLLWSKQLFTTFNHEWLFSPIGFVSTLLAHKGISSDIKKIKSMDRLR